MQIYELLASYGLTLEGHLERLNSWSEDQVISFLVEVCECMLTHHDRTGASFSFIANSSMGGAAEPCHTLECRLTKAEHTARFASLYADKVLIPDPFEQFVGLTDVTERLVQEISTAILLILSIRPTVEGGLIGFSTGQHSFCEAHYSKILSQEKNIEIACGVLEEQFANNITVECSKSSVEADKWDYCIKGPENLVEHGVFYFIVQSVPEAIAKRAHEKGICSLSHDEVVESGIPQRLASPIVEDLLQQNLYARQGFHYLSNREIDFEVISAVNDCDTDSKSTALFSGLTHSVPLLSNASLAALADLRHQEGEAFKVYRDKLNSTLAIMETESELSENRVREAFKDMIEPELNKIDQVVHENRRLLQGQVRQNVVFGVGMISIGLFGGLLPPNAGEIFAGLGGFRFASQLLENVNELCKEPAEIRKNSCYFLWKATK